MHSPDVRYLPETHFHDAMIEAIAAEAFGPGRFARAAARVREMAAHDRSLSFVAQHEGAIIASVRQTKILIGPTPALMLGPLAVRPQFKRRGIGRQLMRIAAQAAAACGERVIMLVGDRGYYEQLGYFPLRRGAVILPAPVDPDRVLGLPLVDGALEGLSGRVDRRPESLSRVVIPTAEDANASGR